MNRHEHGHLEPHPASGRSHSALAVPPSIKIEHEHLYHELETALSSGGKTGAAARKVGDVLLPHFEEEEAYAMPPLGLLERLAHKEPINPGERKQAIQMAEHLRSEYAKMLEGHKSLTVALRKLASAAHEEKKTEQAAFSEALIVHAQNEEQVLYPATLLIGEYLKLQQNVR
jgi:hypothetical protein